MGKDARQRAEEASMEKERVLMKEKQLTAQNSRLSEELRLIKHDTDSRHNQLMDSLKNKHKSMMTAKESENSLLEDRVAKLEAHNDRLERENKS